MSFRLTAFPASLWLLLGLATGLHAEAESPYLQPDNSLVTLHGTVVAPDANSFELDYGSGTIMVEMDDWNAYGDAHGLKDGDRVTVYGRVDDDFLESITVEAGAVYVEDINSYFHASSADEESMVYAPHLWSEPGDESDDTLTVSGRVRSIDRAARQFTVAIGSGELTVETGSLGYDPFETDGYQQIDAGDWISVSGNLDYERTDGRILKASAITTLQPGAQ